jgi:hypothetical protein
MTLDEELKEAERQKFLAEAEKARTEQKKIELDYNTQLRDSKRSWFLKEKFWKNFVSIFLGFSILGFYVNFIILPSFQKDNIELSLENSKHKKELSDKELRLQDDSVKLHAEKIKNDSFSAVVYSKEIIIDSLGKAYRNLLLTVETNQGSNSGKINEATHLVKNALQNLNITENLSTRENMPKKKIEALFTFTNGLGLCNLSVFSNGTLIQSRQVDQSSTVEIELAAGLYVFAISGTTTGQVVIDVHGKDISVTPSIPITFSTKVFNAALAVGIK